MPHDPRACCLDALAAARNIQGFCADVDYDHYAGSRLLRAAVEREFEIIGEALNRSSRIRQDVFAGISDAPRIIGFRNVLAHGYDVVSDLAVWQVIEDKLPTLIEELEALAEDGS